MRRSVLLLGVLAAACWPAGVRAAEPGRLERLGRILALEDARVQGGAELPRLLRDSNPTVRRRAALAVGRNADVAAVPALIDLMNDPVVEVRRLAAFSLGLAGDKRAVDRLVASLHDDDSLVRARSAEALGSLGETRAAGPLAQFVVDAIPGGAPLLTIRGDDPGNPEDPWIELRLALFALARLRDPGAAERALLQGGKPRFDWWAASYTAMRVASPGLRPVLLAAAASTDPQSRALAARGLGALHDPAVLDLLATLTRDRDAGVAVQALRALGEIADRRGAAIAAAALRGRDPVLRLEALRTLARVPGDASLRDDIVALVGAPEPWIREAALPALARSDPGGLPFVLSGLDADAEWSVRAARARALAEAGGELAAGILHAMLRDEDPRVLPAVLEALRTARGKDAVPTLIRHLEHADAAVRASAAEGLGELGGDAAVAALVAVYPRYRSDPDPDPRAAVVASLSKLGAAEGLATLRQAARDDPAVAVRAAAAAALAGRGEVVAPAAVASPFRPALDDVEAMLPYDPRLGEPVYAPRAVLHTTQGRVEVELDVVEAPLTTAAFVSLARRGFYAGLAFHRFVPGFVVQGGGPRGDGYGGPGYTLRSEPGTRPFARGTVGMASAGKDTEGSQFFVTLSPQPHLDGRYTRLGQVREGMDVIDRLRPGDRILRVEIWDGR